MLQGEGYGFDAPGGWAVTRSARSIEASRGIAVVSVTRFPLLRGFRPTLWPKVVPEIDRIAAGVASDQRGTLSSRTTTALGGEQARRYDIEYVRDGKHLVERLGFVLHAKTEYELLCRFEQGKSTSACDELFRTFRLS